MNANILRFHLALALVAVLLAALHAPAVSPPSLSVDLAGTWAGAMTHDGESQPAALQIETGPDSIVGLSVSLPFIHLDRVLLGRVTPRIEGDSVRLGPFTFQYDREAGSLSGIMPLELVPFYSVVVRLRRTERFEMPYRAPLTAPDAAPVWTFEAGSPLWAGPVFAAGMVYVGAQDGWIHAIDARTGAKRWAYRADGPIRTRPTVNGRALYVQADDGFLYALDATSGRLRWRVKVVERPIERLPFDHPKSRYDRFGSDVTVAGNRLYVGTHDGKLLALATAGGARAWEFAAGDAVLAAPAVVDGRVLFGSYDHFVYALDVATGRPLWKRDTGGAVVSTPAVVGDRVVCGNRCYDLLGLDVRTGEVAWKHYVWMSWIESSATIRDGVAYVGSSDAALLQALDARTGRLVWATDVHGWAWGQPAVTSQRVYTGTSGQAGYPASHSAGVLALDRASGQVAWRFASQAPDSGAYGFPGSPAVGSGRVFVGGLDGRVYAFSE